MLINDIKKSNKDSSKIILEDAKKKAPDFTHSQKNHQKIHDIRRKTSKTLSLEEEKVESDTKISKLHHSIENSQQEGLDFSVRKKRKFALADTWSIFFAMSFCIFLSLLVILPIGKATTSLQTGKSEITAMMQITRQTASHIKQFHFTEAEAEIIHIENKINELQNELQTQGGFEHFLFLGKSQNFNQEVWTTIKQSMETLKKSMGMAKTLQTLIQDQMSLPLSEFEKKYPDMQSIIESFFTQLEEIKISMEKIQVTLQELKNTSTEIEKITDQITPYLNTVRVIITFIQGHKNEIQDMLGFHGKRRYVVLLQNQDEIRATGGFIGSMYFLAFDQGKLVESYFKDVYDLDGQITTHIDPPYGLSPITKQYGLRDSNYLADFPASALNVISFIKLAKGPEIHGVIAINQQLIIDLLQITGSIAIPERKLTISSENFSVLMSYIVESKINKAQPKTIVKEFIPLFFKQVTKNQNLGLALDVILRQMGERNIVLFHTTENVERLIENVGLSGNMRYTEGTQDYFLFSDTSVSGNKSDRYIVQNVKHDTWIENTGKIKNTVTLTKKHTFDAKEKSRWQDIFTEFKLSWPEPWLENILGNGKNRSYVRMYVPYGSQLLQAQGVEMKDVQKEEEQGKTVFGFFMETLPGKSSQVEIQYALPKSLDITSLTKYEAFIEKQIGGKAYFFEKEITLDPLLKWRAAFPKDMDQTGDKLHFQDLIKNTAKISAMIQFKN